jgi:hypothetical protein
LLLFKNWIFSDSWCSMQLEEVGLGEMVEELAGVWKKMLGGGSEHGGDGGGDLLSATLVCMGFEFWDAVPSTVHRVARDFVGW